MSEVERLSESLAACVKQRDSLELRGAQDTDRIRDLETLNAQLSDRISNEVFPPDNDELHNRLEAAVDAVEKEIEIYTGIGKPVPSPLTRIRTRLIHLRDGGAI